MLWDLDTGKCMRTFKRAFIDVKSIAFGPDGRQTLSRGARWDTQAVGYS